MLLVPPLRTAVQKSEISNPRQECVAVKKQKGRAFELSLDVFFAGVKARN